MAETASVAPIIEMSGIHKRFPGVHALRGVDLELHRGEVVALLGENGAGKSTLIKVLGGAHQPSEGRISIDGRESVISSPVASQAAGIAVIYQEFNLVPALSVRENIFLGREQTRAGRIDHQQERRQAQHWLEQIGFQIDPDSLCQDLTIAQQQAVEIAKALSTDARMMIMDEPSAALSPAEVEQLHQVIRGLQARDIAVVYISHRLEEVEAICDRAVVLRDGACVGSGLVAELSRGDIIEMMVGRSMDAEFPPRTQRTVGEEKLRVENLSAPPQVRGVSLRAHAGEVLGIAGLVGAGRSETMRALFGADRRATGEIFIDGEPVDIRAPRDAIEQGIAFLTEDRKAEGLVLGHSVLHNFGLPNLQRFRRPPASIDTRAERRAFADYTDQLGIKISSPEQLAGQLSGGNQQKVVIAKWLERDADILIFDEPTRGIDVGAKYEIYQLIDRLCEQGKAIIMISSELSELLGMCDRILVMHEGQIRGEITDVASASQEDLLKIAIDDDHEK